ncbi:hypothetical protein [Planosporangium mesophilum]|uniref:Uncharacterized protein n=1 Tax=Planosporangium mesophilum TaxID=689768 RepID=A0A8J3WZF4_9ACTN|nr:hypothetical protein [Planosporangium mesophilum]NJC82131.1 hypothetical protein [Planosporangium mesophilum]GII22177.1 hypothetical protein Pme01_17740 [Planosporangium mesophilum]
MSTPELDRLAAEYRTWATHWSRPQVQRADLTIPPMVPLTPALAALLDKVAAAEAAYLEAQDAPEDILADARRADTAYRTAVREIGVAVADGKPTPKTLPKPVDMADVETRMRIAMATADTTARRLNAVQRELAAAIEADRPRWREPILTWMEDTAHEREQARQRAQELSELEAMANDGLRRANDALGVEQPKGPNQFVIGASYPGSLVG